MHSDDARHFERHAWEEGNMPRTPAPLVALSVVWAQRVELYFSVATRQLRPRELVVLARWPRRLSYAPVPPILHVLTTAFAVPTWPHVLPPPTSHLQPQNEHIELHRKRHGRRLDYEERR
jgi:hypothetical protein